jgi:hypothetical protein
MGTDIHGNFQAKRDGTWHDVPSTFDEDRNYFLFAWLAGVRNGYGFAGIKTHDPLVPLAEPRGYPEDFQVEDDGHKLASNALRGKRASRFEDEDSDPENDDYLRLWMGDHSHSWLSADEILDAPDQGVKQQGVISLETYLTWDGKCPSLWSGAITGPGIVTIDVSAHNWAGRRPTIEPIEGVRKYVLVGWFTESVRDSLSEFIDEVRRLKDLHGEVRYVFGFDS